MSPNGDGENQGNQFRLRELERRQDETDDELKEYYDLLNAWRAGKFIVRVILMIGAVVVTIGAIVATTKTLFGLAPHP